MLLSKRLERREASKNEEVFLQNRNRKRDLTFVHFAPKLICLARHYFSHPKVPGERRIGVTCNNCNGKKVFSWQELNLEKKIAFNYYRSYKYKPLFLL